MLGDYMVSSCGYRRYDVIEMTGCSFALAFLTPFFRPLWVGDTKDNWFGRIHFVTSMSIYDTVYSFAMILHGSIVSDDAEMTEANRVRLLCVFKIVNLAGTFVITRLGLHVFDAQDLSSFLAFVCVVAMIAGLLSLVAQGVIVTGGDGIKSWRNLHRRICKILFPLARSKEQGPRQDEINRGKLGFKRIALDFWNHKNFWAWIGANMLMESANNFNHFFCKTFFDQLVVSNPAGGIDRNTSDWIISSLRPLTAALSLLAFWPIRKYGYVKVLRFLFVINALMALLMLVAADWTCVTAIVAFLIVFPTITSAIHSAVFHLAMADMVMEMKHLHASAGRFDEASFAGLFMGANALFCKPMDAIFAIAAARAMSSSADNPESTDSVHPESLFRLLVFSSLVYSCLQYWSWHFYTLEPVRTAKLRSELKTMLLESGNHNDVATGPTR